MKLLIASNNPHKIRELRGILEPMGFEVASPAEIGIDLEVTEAGSTFAANSLTKARAFQDASGLPTLADDSGLVVDALGGEPGVLSARYGGPGLTDADRTHLVLERMKEVPDGRRTGRFVAAVAIAGAGGEDRIFEGVAEGSITHEMRGEEGFGYDPIFFYPPANRTFAELSAEEKSRVSHRGKAARAAAGYLKKHL